MEVRQIPKQLKTWLKTYGTLDGAGELMSEAWPSMQHIFAVRRSKEAIPSCRPSNQDPIVKIGYPRMPSGLLEEHQVDMLIVDRSSVGTPPRSCLATPWESSISRTATDALPKVVLESWISVASTWARGPVSKLSMARWTTLGYDTFCKCVSSTSVGGALLQARLLVSRVQSTEAKKWHWPPLQDEQGERPMSNLLIPPGLVPKHLYLRDTKTKSINGVVPDARVCPMPDRPGALIRTEHGIRGLQLEEYCRGLGMSSSASKLLSRAVAVRTTSLFHWEYLSPALAGAPAIVVSPHQLGLRTVHKDSDDDPTSTDPVSAPFAWKPPNLREGGRWYLQRIRNLKQACSGHPNSDEIYHDGLKRLLRHRHNYDDDGPNPKWLQLLWWEYAPEHWEDLRLGFRQHFLSEPPSVITPNADMDIEGLEAARIFVDELVNLGVLRDPEEGFDILANAPLFVLPKEGQPGEWRVLADMLRGGQNAHIGADPCFLPRVSHILEEMYSEGYSAVVDMSKYFYNFPTHPKDRKYLGLIHPVTGHTYAYFGLPMGSSSSPGHANRIGVSFVRQLKEQFAVFQGKGRANCYWTGFKDNGFDPHKGYGMVLENKNGGAVLIWAFVDDFLVHGPTLESVQEALKLFLDSAVDHGLLAHPKKLIPPCQEVKYCGFLFNTVGTPCLKIPKPKRERALAICELLLHSPAQKKWSRLSLAVAAGVLESLSEATPRRLGHNRLRHLHSLVHPADCGTGIAPYYTTTLLNGLVLEEVTWWATYLKIGKGRFVRPSRASTLIPTWGDGSGTGTGGTFVLPDEPSLMWSATWSPAVYKFSSNWKELSTLKQSLERLLEHGNPAAIRNSTVFYFTDNSVTYYIAACGSSPILPLHRLISEIRILEMRLGIALECIHVPGVVMIQQGTDGLSRGIWMSSLHAFLDQSAILTAVFAPLPFDEILVYKFLPREFRSSWFHQEWQKPWNAQLCFHHLSVWFPPPELARQSLTFMLNTWIEQPATTACLFFIPRSCSAAWRGLSRFILHIGTITPGLKEGQTRLRRPPLLPIPIEVLYMPPHTRALKLSSRLDTSPNPLYSKWHQEQAALMRGVSPSPLSK